jgi:mRNA-degrading endonuclease RelE of RelBE toxin-antitoxin system
MDFRIADTFTDSLGKLTGEEQKAVKTTAFDLQLNPAHPGLQFHKLEKAKDKRFASVRVSSDVRLIVHRTDGSLLLCYVGHHDDAYSWAERRKLETHPKTGAAQLVEVRETVQEIKVPKYVEVEQPALPKPRLLAGVSEEALLSYGVPAEWLNDVRNATEDTLLGLADHLPSEAAEAVLDLATGATPKWPTQAMFSMIRPIADIGGVVPDIGHDVIEGETAHYVALDLGRDAFDHPDAQRRFRTITSQEELERAFEYPWEKWTVFLHPIQRSLVERDYNGPARVSGSAGTGKTIVALHRAVFLARTNPGARVLLTTFSDALANALRTKLRRLISNEPRLGERLEVHSMNAIGRRLFELNVGRPQIATSETIDNLLKEAAAAAEGNKFSLRFLTTEWWQVVDAWQLDSWEAYRDVVRLGRKTRLQEKQRVALWSIFNRVRTELQSRGLTTHSGLFSRLASKLAENVRPAFEFVVVDEAQDVSVAQLQFLAALGGKRPNGVFFAGDLGQRIFQQPFSWKALGVDVRGRSFTLRVNYRTSHQIRSQADRLLGPELSDVDGITEKRGGTVSTFNGPPPEILILDTAEDEIKAVSQWLVTRTKEGIVPHEIGVFVRSAAQLDRARSAMKGAGLPFKVLDENVETTSGYASISTMHLAKGLEFRTVVVMACDDEVIPLQERIQMVGDDADLEEVYATERHLLYVACTRARDHLLVTGVEPASEFLDDLRK